MEPKIREFHRVLKNTGSIYLHCDWHANAHLRILMDSPQLFGASNFRNSIVWHYSGWNKKNKFDFNSRHDTILLYGKSERQQFNSYAEPWESKEEYVKVRKQKVRLDSGGRQYVLSDAGAGNRVKRYLDDAMKSGAYVDDVWDIDKLNNSAKEALGYPTQKPEVLLERVVLASSNPMETVLDPFCGCGTAIAVSQKLGRRWIGIDVSPTACKIIVQRMSRLGVPITENDIVGLPRTLQELRGLDWAEFQNWACQKLGARVNEKKVRDMGIDGWLWDKPVQVKRWGHSVGRPEIEKFESVLRRENKNEGIIVSFSFTSDSFEEVARLKNETHPERRLVIQLVTTKELVGEDEQLLTTPEIAWLTESEDRKLQAS